MERGYWLRCGLQERHRPSARVALTHRHRTLAERWSQVSDHDPYFLFIGKGRKYDLQMKSAELKDLGRYDCVVIVTDHYDCDYGSSGSVSPAGGRHPERHPRN